MADTRIYELVFIARPDVDKEGLGSLVEQLTRVVTVGGGEVVKVNEWGKRRLAYPIQRLREGHYVLMQIQQHPEKIEELNQSLQVQENVIRHLIVRMD